MELQSFPGDAHNLLLKQVNLMNINTETNLFFLSHHHTLMTNEHFFSNAGLILEASYLALSCSRLQSKVKMER